MSDDEHVNPEQQADEDNRDYDDEDDNWCPTCNCRGFIITCPDDLCHGGDHCIHGDGEEICPDCKGRWL